MVFRRGISCFNKVALGLVFTISMPLTVLAQGGGPALYTPAADARDLKSVLFNWTWNMGMLRGVDEYELVVSLEYQGNGSIQVDGQNCTLNQYRTSTNYQLPGQRTQYTCTLPNGQSYSNIEVVSGEFAWNEDVAGAELVAEVGSVSAMPSTLEDRLIRLWASPQGAPKAALAGAGIDLIAMNRNPSRLPDGVVSIGSTAVSWQAGKPVVTYSIPGVTGATATATLNEQFMAERVVVRQGPSTTEFIYSDYQDWNNPLNKIEAYYAGNIVESRNGTVLRYLTTTETEIGSVYVVMPVPSSIGVSEPTQLLPSDRTMALVQSAQTTPRGADGRPDLTGNWGASGMNWRYGNRRCAPSQLEGCSSTWNQTIDFELEAPSRFGPNRPSYKPEHWDEIQQLDMWTNREDPVMTCQSLGIPRQGPPRRIIQSANDVVLLYGEYADGDGGYGEYRIIPTDDREHNERQALQSKYMGYTSGALGR